MKPHAGYTVSAISYDESNKKRLRKIADHNQKRKRRLNAKNVNINEVVENIINIIRGED